MPDAQPWKTQQHVRGLLIAIVVLAVLFVALLTIYLITLRQAKTNDDVAGDAGTEQQSSGSSATLATTPTTLPAEPATVMTRTGKLVRVEKDTIVFVATVYDDGQQKYVPRELTAETKDTIYTEVDKSKPIAPPVPGQRSQSSGVSAIERRDLHISDTIQIFSGQNIRGETRFPVTEVRRLLL